MPDVACLKEFVFGYCPLNHEFRMVIFKPFFGVALCAKIVISISATTAIHLSTVNFNVAGEVGK
jgi:hypothetical protein